jgi:hypothetical protein
MQDLQHKLNKHENIMFELLNSFFGSLLDLTRQGSIKQLVGTSFRTIETLRLQLNIISAVWGNNKKGGGSVFPACSKEVQHATHTSAHDVQELRCTQLARAQQLEEAGFKACSIDLRSSYHKVMIDSHVAFEAQEPSRTISYTVQDHATAHSQTDAFLAII